MEHERLKPGRKMTQKTAAKILKALAILILCFPLPLRAATSDDFIQGYASAVLEREFRIKNFSLNVTDEIVRIESVELADADHDKVIAALLSIQGVKEVEILGRLNPPHHWTGPPKPGRKQVEHGNFRPQRLSIRKAAEFYAKDQAIA